MKEDQDPSIRMSFHNFGLPHLVIIALGLLGGGSLWLHGDSRDAARSRQTEADKTAIQTKIDANRTALVQELTAKISEKMDPLEKRLEDVEDCQKRYLALDVQLARLTQALDDMRAARGADRIEDLRKPGHLGIDLEP